MHVIKTYWGREGIEPRTYLGTRTRWVVSFRPRPLYPLGNSPGTNWIGGWVGPRAGLDEVVNTKIPRPCRESNPRTPIVHPVVSRYIDCLLCNGYRGLLPGGKTAGERSWPLTSIQRGSWECVELHLHSPIIFHGVVLIWAQAHLYLTHDVSGDGSSHIFRRLDAYRQTDRQTFRNCLVFSILLAPVGIKPGRVSMLNIVH
jgi:hypothetical protein